VLVWLDQFLHVRRARTPTFRRAAVWSATHVGIVILFGVGVWIVGWTALGIEYFAYYMSNEALSVDNLFVFLFIIGSFAVPRIAKAKSTVIRHPVGAGSVHGIHFCRCCADHDL
jgi:tellurite resistance protein TerC